MNNIKWQSVNFIGEWSPRRLLEWSKNIPKIFFVAEKGVTHVHAIDTIVWFMLGDRGTVYLEHLRKTLPLMLCDGKLSDYVLKKLGVVYE